VKVKGGSNSCLYGPECDDVQVRMGLVTKVQRGWGVGQVPRKQKRMEEGRDESRGSLSDCPFKPDRRIDIMVVVICHHYWRPNLYQVPSISSQFSVPILCPLMSPNVYIDRRPSKLSASMVAPIREEARRLISRSAILYRPSQRTRPGQIFD
jgi:hypothetical protein